MCHIPEHYAVMCIHCCCTGMGFHVALRVAMGEQTHWESQSIKSNYTQHCNIATQACLIALIVKFNIAGVCLACGIFISRVVMGST